MRELQTEAKIENLNTVLSFVDEYLEENDCSLPVQMQIDVAVEELFVNIAHYAYASGDGPAEIQTEIIGDPRICRITFIDSGIPFDPLAKPDPDTTLSVIDRQIGGLGIFMVKKSMDTFEYERKDGKNIVTITKLL